MANSLNEKKIAEGLSLLKEADKCLRTNWLKWKPDLDNAADKFMKAGTAFKVAKAYDQAKDAFCKAADAHQQNHSLFHAGKALEQAGVMMKEMKRVDYAADLLQRAGALFYESGTPDTASLVLKKAAKMCEGSNINKAIELYQSAGEMCEMDDKLREAAEPYSKCTQLLLKLQKYEEAVKSLNKQFELYERIGNTGMQFKVLLGLTVVYLSEGDYVSADKCFKDAFEVHGFGSSDEAEVMEELLNAYDENDEEKLKTIVRKPVIRNLDNELSKLARDLKPSEEFNIRGQEKEIRFLSRDNPPGEQLICDDDENPLGSEESAKDSKEHDTIESNQSSGVQGIIDDNVDPLGSKESAEGLQEYDKTESTNQTYEEGIIDDNVNPLGSEESARESMKDMSLKSDLNASKLMEQESAIALQTNEQTGDEKVKSSLGDEDEFEGGLC